jgi:hypothetical protein
MDLKKLIRPPAIAAKLGVTLVMLVALSSSLLLLRASTESFTDGHDYASSYEKRFEVVKRVLPKGETIGFRSDAGGGDYFMANYALSPILVEFGDGPRVYLLNVTRDSSPEKQLERLYARPSLAAPSQASAGPDRPGEYSIRRTADGTVYDFGNGVMVVERDSK